MKKSIHKSFSIGSLTSFPCIHSVSFPEQITVDRRDIKDVITQRTPNSMLIWSVNCIVLAQLIGSINTIHIMIVIIDYTRDMKPFEWFIAENRLYDRSICGGRRGSFSKSFNGLIFDSVSRSNT